ncbi:MAG: ethanolamine utilization protein EutN [Bacteroidetes bacterium HGW-Bacteroidetes-16]|jgi:microcompartment protein CcmK/EutM|nr:MAG: ethanolamine utilization protein EutN [Bacteroidetes bacterium HGW-Bacteroidetes-16]
MILARVAGTVVSSQKVSQMEGLKLLLLEKIDPVSMQGKNDFIVAMDGVGAGVDEIVFYVSGSSARMAETTKGLPTDATVVAIVDLIELKGTLTYQNR